MTTNLDQREDVADEAWVAGFKKHWAAPNLTVQERAAFDRGVWRKVERANRPRLVPALVGATVVAAFALLTWVGNRQGAPSVDWVSSLYEAEVVAASSAMTDETTTLVAWRTGALAGDDVASDVSGEYGVLAQWVIVASNDEQDGDWLP